ncbi:MAG TPA: histidine phosphatase family protein [Stellaceae bacterium]|jgi:probable phosphoglycerate mutase|nr:histidine phosphatase family protein [Stellaceae bacterium]
MTTIVLTRHGHVDGISPLRFRGRTETPLTALGRRQADATAARIAASWHPRAVYTSPMGRCVATGQAIAHACGVPSETLPDLIDFDYGAWQWRTVEEVRAAWPELLAAWHATPHLVRFPNGDALQDLVARTANAVRFVLARHADETIVLVGHETANRAILLQLLDQPLSAYWRLAQEPCAINEIEIANGHVRVLTVNDVSHVRGL